MTKATAPATGLLASFLTGAYGIEQAIGGENACDCYGFVAAHPTLGSAFSSLFLHDPSTIFHLICNLVFLVIFGGLVERTVGSLPFLGLFFLAGLGGAGFHMLVDPSSTVPLVGCSGALFGLLA